MYAHTLQVLEAEGVTIALGKALSVSPGETIRLFAIHHTILVVALSCKGQPAPCRCWRRRGHYRAGC